jgi:hypothetical protein
MTEEKNNKPSFSAYGFSKSFQEKLAILIYEDRPFSDQIGEVLQNSFFEYKHLQVFVEKVYSYKQKYESHPTDSAFETILRGELDDHSEILKKQVRMLFARLIAGREEEHKDHKYIKDRSLNFCRTQSIKKALLHSVDLLDTEDFDKVLKSIEDACKLGTDNNFGHDFMKDFEKRFVLRERSPVTTGWKEVDQITGAGLGKGELGVVIAPTGAGKSMALVHLGAQAAKSGLNVIHYTLELADTVVAKRYDCCITGFTLNAHYGLKDEIYEKISSLSLGNLIVKEYPTKTASTQTLRNHLEKLRKRDIKIDMIIVDYADLLKPVSAQRELRNELGGIYEDLRAMSQQYECPVWTASQTNRAGYNAQIVQPEQISEAFNKCFIADFICTISRTAEDKQANKGTMYVAKNRNGPDGIAYPMFIDTSSVDMKVFPNDGMTIESVEREKKQDYTKAMKEKYKQFNDANKKESKNAH